MKKLHLGCGNKRIDDFINIDIRESISCDLVDDVGELKSFEDNSVDLIYASHVLEHFGRNEYKKILKRWYDVLKKNGVLRLSVPNLEVCFKEYVENKIPLKQLLGFLYGGQNYKENFHYIGFDFEMLQNDLIEIGFSEINLWDWRQTEHSHIDDYSQAYLPHMDKENGRLMSLNIQAKK